MGRPLSRGTAWRRLLGPLLPLLAFFCAGVLGLGASRAFLTLAWASRVRRVDAFWLLFPIGARMDVITLCIALFVPTPLVLLLPRRGNRAWRTLLGAYFAAVAGLLTFMEVATVPFLAQYDSRPNRIFIDYLRYPREVLPTVWAEHKLAVVLALVFVGAAVRATWAASAALMDDRLRWSWPWRALLLPPLALLLFLGARSTLGHRAANISTAAFSGDHLVNELTLNATYALGYAVYTRQTEMDAGRLYGRLPREEALARVRRRMLLPDNAFTREDLPLVHRQRSSSPRSRPYNLVIFLQESLGAEFVGSLGGRPLTPHLDALGREGLFLTNLYSTGTRTVRGIEATVSGFLPMPGDSVVKLGLAQGGFFTIADLLRRAGYATDFIYGGASNFDNMRGFFLNNGFERVIDQRAFDHPVFEGTWGVSDEDLARKANAIFRSHGDAPFFALMLSTSNHEPFEFPPGRIALQDGEPANTQHNAVRYADYSIGEFFRLAKQEEYYRRTVFLVVADHDIRVFGAQLVPIDRFHIPGLIIGPGVAPRRYDRLASQVDLPPTLIDLMGLDVEHPMAGHDLLAVPDDVPGHAFMQYDLANAYRVGDQVVVQQPFREPKQFTWREGRLVPTRLDPELARDAVAHVQVPTLLYRERRYRLPAPAGRTRAPPLLGADDHRMRAGERV